MGENGVPVLAVYDFRSKQEFIYRTNRMREITGASELIAGMYGEFLKERSVGCRIRNDWQDSSSAKPLLDDEGNPLFLDGEVGIVVYEGGGNLLVLYRDRDAYREANRVFSTMVIDRAYTLSMVSAASDWRSDKGFEWNRCRAYEQFDRAKRLGCPSVPCNVLPYTQVDRMTYQPIVRKDDPDYGDTTREGEAKKAAYSASFGGREGQERHVDRLAAERGRDSLVAVLYFDGNSIGERVKSAVSDRPEGQTEVDAIRGFSKNLHQTMVDNTREAMVRAIEGLPERYRRYRVIIDHGDEITLLCNAHAAPYALDAYFAALEGTGYHACGGMAICHSHDPFAQVYRIAEECCESGKERNREIQKEAMAKAASPDDSAGASPLVEAALGADGDYVDFHFCRAGITGSLKQIRRSQEEGLTGRPYRVGEGQTYGTFLRVGELLASSSHIRRTDVKALNQAMLRGWSWYALEYERIRAKDLGTMSEVERTCGADAAAGDDARRKAVASYLFDVTSFYDVYDLRFGALDGEDEGNG